MEQSNISVLVCWWASHRITQRNCYFEYDIDKFEHFNSKVNVLKYVNLVFFGIPQELT